MIFDGVSPTTPCLYAPLAPPTPPVDLKAIPDNFLVSPVDVPHNDSTAHQQVEQLTHQLHPSPRPPPDTCTVNPPGFVCGHLPALPGEMVECVPRMDHSDLNQLSARVLPLSVSRANGALDDPARADPRYALYHYPPAYSRCCAGNQFSAPSAVKPALCGSHTKVAPVDANEMGFRTNPKLMAQLKLTAHQLARTKAVAAMHARSRDAMWRSEAGRLKAMSMGSGIVPTLGMRPPVQRLGDFL